MYKRILCIMMLCLVPAVTFSQQPPAADAKKSETKDPFSPQSVKTDTFLVSMPTFTRKTDTKGRGEVMELSFEISSTIDSPQEFYIFSYASYEENKWNYNSFDTKKTFIEKTNILYFIPFPDDRTNFEYDEQGGKVIKRYPKDFKKGVDPETGKTHRLDLTQKIVFRSDHLSVYRANFKYFNNACVLIYDVEGKLVFRQVYSLEGLRH